MPNKLKWIVPTFFYVGYLPVCPGSFASVLGWGLAFLLKDHVDLYIFVFGLVTVLGFLTAGGVEHDFKKKDPSCVVIDEVSGAMLAFFAVPMTWPVMITGFFLFRAFDMFKIYPSDRWENLPGSYGIMLDDLVAGLYTNFVLQLALLLVGRVPA